MAKIAKTHEDIEAQILEIQGMKATLLEEGDQGVGLDSTGFYDQEIYGGSDSRFAGYVTSIAANEQEEDDEEDSTTSLLGQKKPGYHAPVAILNAIPQSDEQYDPFAEHRPPKIAEREDEYKARRRQMIISPERLDPFADGGKTPDPKLQVRSYVDVMLEQNLSKEEREIRQQLAEKAKSGDLKAVNGSAASQAAAAAAAKRKRRWDQTADQTPTTGNTTPKKISTWDQADSSSETPGHTPGHTPAHTPSSTRWDETPGRPKGSDTPGATPSTRMWDPTPSHTPAGAATPGRDTPGHATPGHGGATGSVRKNRWDETPKTERETPGHGSGWAETPRTDRGDESVGETPTPGASKRKSRWDETPASQMGSSTPLLTPGKTPIGTPAMNMATPTPGHLMSMTPEQLQAWRWEREIDERNRPLTDDELDAMFPEGYKVLPPPAGYVPIRTPARKLSATPTPIGGMTGFHMQVEDRTTKQMNDQPSGNLPFLKPDDIQYFDKLLVEVDESTLSPEEQKERKIMKLLLKIKNGTPPMRKAALRQITDKAREFGAGPLFNQILPLLMSPTLEDQERHLLVKVIDRILYKLDDLVRPYVHKILVVIEPLLIDEDYYARVEGREIISNLAKAAGLATMISTMRPDIDNMDEYVRNTTARAFAVVASALGIPSLLPFLKAVCKSKKSWQARHTGIKIVQQIAILMGCAILPHLRSLVEIIEHGLVDEQQKVRTISALAIAALAEAATPYGIESFDSVLKPLWKGIRQHRGKGLAAFLKAIGYLIPLMDAEYANYYTREVMLILIREFQSPDEEMKKIVLKVVKQCCGTDGVEANYIKTEILPPFFKHFCETAQPAGPAVSCTEEPQSAKHFLPEPDQSDLLDTLQRSTCVGELSAFDMEKYLKKTDLSGSTDGSVAHTTFDLTGWADNLNSSRRNPQTGYPEEQGSLAQRVDSATQQKPTKIDAKERTLNTSSSAMPPPNALSPGHKGHPKRSSIPRPRTSFSSASRSVGSGQSSTVTPPADKMTACGNCTYSAIKTCGSSGRTLTENGVKSRELNPQASNNIRSSLETSQKSDKGSAVSPGLPRTPPDLRKGRSGLPCFKGSSSPPQRVRSAGQQQQDRLSNSSEKKLPPSNIMDTPLPRSSVEKHVGFSSQNTHPPQGPASDLLKGFFEPCVEETQCNFRPSTSPLTHSSPSQTSIPSADSMVSPASSSGGLADKHPGLDLSPESICFSPSLSRLTYISMNDGTVVPSPERQKNNCTMALSTTIIRISPTPPVEPDADLDILGLPKNLDQVKPEHSKSLDPLPAQQCKSPEPSRSASGLSCTRSQSECNYHYPRDRTGDLSAGCRKHKHLSESNVRQLTKVDSGYCSNLNIQQTSNTATSQSSQKWGAASSVSTSVYASGLCMPPSYSSEGLHYVPIPSFKPQCAGLIDLPHQGDMQSLLAGRSVFNPQLAQQYLGPEVPIHTGSYHVGATGNSLYSVSSTGIPNSNFTVRHPTSGPLGISQSPGSHPLPRPHQGQQDMGMMGKPYGQYGAETLIAGCLEELRGQVVVPEELRFPHNCCVGIASQTSLSLFNPSERWQQVSITVTNLAIDGEKVDSMLYQWLIVKNKTIIAPKSTEEQKVLFIPPQAGVYQCIFSVCSWPASAETEVAAGANIFAKRVVLVAIAENPALEVEVSKSGCLDFGDLPGGSAKSLPLNLINRTHATVPIRLIISANASAWRCFTFSKHPVTITSEATQQAGHMATVSSPSVMNHVMHASYGENPQGFMVWVHFKAPQKYTVSSGELGPADEYIARVDIEVDSPGPSHVIRSIPLRARSGTARVHAPKDLQTVSLSAPLGKSSQQTLPLKNAGNIDVQLKLKSSDAEDNFSVTPDELSLRMGEEQGIVVSFKAQGSKTFQESLLTILVLPSGPQYEVTLKGEVVPEDSGKPTIPSAAVFGPGVAKDVPPILSNKQFVAWGGVTLGRAVQQKLVLRNNSPNATQQLRLLIRGQDQDCFQLQSMFSPEERLTRHGELSIRPREDVTIHLLFAPTRVACMLAKLEIKQSGVRSSQPGVKFTIPLSGYGGTSNIILEDQRKQADGYVAMLTDIAVSRVSKVCLCVRNTGSRAAFIKAVAFSDVQTRSVMDSSVISLAPSQFVLKERTQEVITVLMKSTQREQVLCQSANALLATVCLFCGDEVSRQQYRRLLQSKPEAVRKALSENSLLKNINFNEKFLGEDNVTEIYDLPQRPNEAHIFYGNMSKVVVSLLGSNTKSTGCEQSDHTELLMPSARQSSETDSGLANGNVSLDVLPVKGPQGPALRVAEPSLKASESLHRQSESWTIHPEQLVLAAPTIDGAATTCQVQIRNNTSRELSFELSWPAHCLTITPQHGVIEPQCHLQILISPNPSLATKSTLLPWSGQIYVQCDGQQKFIKVQIRGDLALDVSASPADKTLSALPPQAATPVLPVAGLTAQTLVEISNKTITFPSTPSGETSEAQLEVQNGEVEVRWYLSSFAPPYVKGVDNTGDVYRATYTAFRCSRVSGTLGAYEKIQVPITFLPRDRGDYAQFWDLECHPVSEPHQKTRIRFQLCGNGIKSGQVEGPQEGDCSLVKTEATVKTRKRADPSAGKTSQEEAVRRGVYSPQDLYTFPATRVGESSTLKVNIRNNSSDTHELKFVNPMEPYHIKHSKYSLRSQHYLKLPVQFKPSTAGRHTGLLLIQSETSGSLVIQLTGDALP